MLTRIIGRVKKYFEETGRRVRASEPDSRAWMDLWTEGPNSIPEQLRRGVPRQPEPADNGTPGRSPEGR